MANLCNTHVKLLAFDFISLTPSPSDQSTFSRSEIVGIITTRDLKPNKFLRFTVGDPSDVRRIADVAARLASAVQFGVVARVRGRITGYRGMVQITVTDVSIQRDPNAEIPHWLQCVKLASKCYDALTCLKQT